MGRAGNAPRAQQGSLFDPNGREDFEVDASLSFHPVQGPFCPPPKKVKHEILYFRKYFRAERWHVRPRVSVRLRCRLPQWSAKRLCGLEIGPRCLRCGADAPAGSPVRPHVECDLVCQQVLPVRDLISGEAGCLWSCLLYQYWYNHGEEFGARNDHHFYRDDDGKRNSRRLEDSRQDGWR